jgi:hypothetical protein
MVAGEWCLSADQREIYQRAVHFFKSGNKLLRSNSKIKKIGDCDFQ